ncbi:MAG: methyltransferase [Myxococcota bacterium]|nr:methyltransferase [Myxococcota bacterium]
MPVPLLVAQVSLAGPGSGNWVFFGAFLLLGEAIRLWAAGVIGRQYRTRGSEVGSLATGGPYGHVRNPLYIGNTFQWVGLGGFSGPLWALAWLLCAVGLYRSIVPWEEQQVRAAWPLEFERWSREVPAWIPRVRAYGERGTRFSLAQALRSERSTLLVWLGVVALLALT